MRLLRVKMNGLFGSPSPALVVSLLALFVALAGTTYAATSLPKNSVGTAQLKNGAVTKKKISRTTRTALKGNRGPQGPNGATGPPGLQGMRGMQGLKGDTGATGPSASFQNIEEGNLNIGATGSAHITLTSLTLSGPSSYLINATGSLFPNGGPSSNCDGFFELTLDGTEVGSQNDAGASRDSSGQYVEGAYAVLRLINVGSGSHTLKLEAVNVFGNSVCTSYENIMTATLVGSASGAQTAAHLDNKVTSKGGPGRR